MHGGNLKLVHVILEHVYRWRVIINISIRQTGVRKLIEIYNLWMTDSRS